MHKKKKSKKMEGLVSDVSQRLEGIQSIPSVLADRALKIGALSFLALFLGSYMGRQMGSASFIFWSVALCIFGLFYSFRLLQCGHYLAQITWQMSSNDLTKTYGELMEEHGKKPFGDIKVFIRVVSSDVGASGANIFYSMMDGNHTIILGEALRIKHQYKRGLEEFTCNMESLFQYYKQKLKDIGRLCDIQIRYPANTLSELMKIAKLWQEADCRDGRTL